MKHTSFLKMSVLGLLLTSYSFVGCSHKQILDRDENTVSKAGVLSLSAASITSKARVYSIGFEIINESKKAFVINATDVGCYRGQERGSVKPGLFGKGQWALNLDKGDQKRFLLTCTFTQTVFGEPRVIIKKVTEDTGDSDKEGKVVTKDFAWSLHKGSKAADSDADEDSESTDKAPAQSNQSQDSGE